MPEPNQTDYSISSSYIKYISLPTLILMGGLVGVGLGNLDRLVCQKKIEDIEVREVGKVSIAYDSGSSDYSVIASIDYKDTPMIHVTNHDRCIYGDELTGIKVGDKLAWIRYSPSSDKCDQLNSFEKK